jgi:hypothetical protein
MILTVSPKPPLLARVFWVATLMLTVQCEGILPQFCGGSGNTG